jgi:hypothetical protein
MDESEELVAHERYRGNLGMSMESGNVGLTIARNPRNVGSVNEGRPVIQKRVNFFCLLLLTMVALALWSGPSRAIEITPSISRNFRWDQWLVIFFAMNSWTQYFEKGGQNISIKFYVNNNLSRDDEQGAIGITRNYRFDNSGRPISADITLDANDLNWAFFGPNPNELDAFTAISHEIGHALGFNYNSPIFRSFVCVGAPDGDQCGKDIMMSGGDRYLDLNRNGRKDTGDRDLVDGTHLTRNMHEGWRV